MPFNGSGVFQRVRNWVADATAGIKIRADYHDSEDDGFAAGLTNCITKDGQTIITQNIPFNSKRITGLADAINAQDAATKAAVDAALVAANAHADAGDAAVTGTANTKVSKSGDTMTWDLTVHRSNTTGYVWLGNSAQRYIGYDGGNYILNGAHVYSAAGRLWGTSDFNYTPQPNLGFTPVRQSGGAYQASNTVYIGWDGGALRAQVDGSDLGRFFMENANYPSAGVRDTRLSRAGDWSVPDQTPTEPYGGAVVTGGWLNRFGDSRVGYIGFKMRYLQVLTGDWYTVSYVG